MSVQPPTDKHSHEIAISPHIAALTNREADFLLAKAEAARLAEIDSFWALCTADPGAAAAGAVGAAPIVHDILALARNNFTPPKPGELESLSKATHQLLAVEAVNAAFPEECFQPDSANRAESFWEPGEVVAVKIMNGHEVLILRYYGPLFNPSAIPENCLTGDEGLYLVCHQCHDAIGGDYESLTAYVIGCASKDGGLEDPDLGLDHRGSLMRDLQAMESLVDHGELSNRYFEVKPLPSFPTSCDSLIAQLQAHQAALRCQGAATVEQEAIVNRRTAPLYQRIEEMRARMHQMDEELDQLRRQILEIEACALEEETGFCRGDEIRHRMTGQEGVLEIVHYGSAQFRLCSTKNYLTEDIRRGEWLQISSAPW